MSGLGLTPDHADAYLKEVQLLHAPPALTAALSVSEMVPAIYFELSKEVHICAMKFISKVRLSLPPLCLCNISTSEPRSPTAFM